MLRTFTTAGLLALGLLLSPLYAADGPHRVLLVAPPPLAEPTILGEVFDEQSVERSRQLADVYQSIAQTTGAAFFDAGSVIDTDGVDAVHFTAESQRALGEALAGKISEVLTSGN